MSDKSIRNLIQITSHNSVIPILTHIKSSYYLKGIKYSTVCWSVFQLNNSDWVKMVVVKSFKRYNLHTAHREYQDFPQVLPSPLTKSWRLNSQSWLSKAEFSWSYFSAKSSVVFLEFQNCRFLLNFHLKSSSKLKSYKTKNCFQSIWLWIVADYLAYFSP